jgi:hypothetical protein
MDYYGIFEPASGLFWKVGSFFLQVGAQFGGTELCKLNHIFRVKLDLILEIVMVMQAVI